jgi:hypothetical protein
VTGYWAIAEGQRVVSEAGSGSMGEVVVRPSDRAREAGTNRMRLKKSQDRICLRVIEAVAVAVSGGKSKETVQTSESVEGSMGKFAGEGAGGGEKAAVDTATVVH